MIMVLQAFDRAVKLLSNKKRHIKQLCQGVHGSGT